MAEVLAEDRLPGPAFDALRDVEIAGGPLAEIVGAPRPDVRAAIVVGGTVSAALLDRLPALEVVARFGVGYDTVDVAACTRRGIQVAITPGPVEAATAELAVALILAVRRRLLAADAAVRRGAWSPPPAELPGEEGLDERTLGLVGFGRIGRRVAQATAALGARIQYTARHRVPPEVEALTGARYASLDELLRTSDVVSLHCPLTDQTRGLIGARELGLLRDRTALINTARGPLVDEPALIAAVSSGRIAVGLDVYADEPHVPRELRAGRHAVLSPHAGSATRAARTRMTELCVENVLTVLAGGRAVHLVPEQQDCALWSGARRG